MKISFKAVCVLSCFSLIVAFGASQDSGRKRDRGNDNTSTNTRIRTDRTNNSNQNRDNRGLNIGNRDRNQVGLGRGNSDNDHRQRIDLGNVNRDRVRLGQGSGNGDRDRRHEFSFQDGLGRHRDNGGNGTGDGQGRGNGGGIGVGRNDNGGANGSGNGLGTIRVGQRDQGRNDDHMTRHTSRSGSVHYGSTNNQRWDLKNYRVDRARIGVLNQLDRRMARNDGRVGIVFGGGRGLNWGLRVGYCHYNRFWRDDNFCYPFYVFDPFAYDRFYCSPWYYYSFLPAYINTTRVIVVNNYYGYNDWQGDVYNYDGRYSDDGYRGNDRRDRDLDFALDDLTKAFDDNDNRTASSLIPRSGTVAIFMDGKYNYSLNPDDFNDLFMDAVENAKTDKYVIESVRTNRGVARVIARHEYTDPSGDPQTVWHTYTLEEEHGQYVIREFGTDYDRP